jgi:hypothetical protein
MLDRSRVLFYFSADSRIDFRQLVRDLARQLDVRIEMRQIGVRDGAGLIGGIGPCGKELCCSSFLKSFRSISIRHAKDQGLTLNPKKVSGMCGRLMCCLVYEHPTYRAGKAGAPRVNRAVETELGPGVVTEVDLLRRQLRVLLEGGGNEVFPFSHVIVDNSTIRRPRDIASQPSRPRQTGGVSRAGTVLEEAYVWDDAEAENHLDLTPSTPAKPQSARDRRKAGGQSDRDRPSSSRQSRGRRRRGRGRGRRKSKADGDKPQAGQASQSAGAEGKSDTPSKGRKRSGRRRGRRRRGRGRGKKSGAQESDGGAASTSKAHSSGGASKDDTSGQSGSGGKSGKSSRRRGRRRRRRGRGRGGGQNRGGGGQNRGGSGQNRGGGGDKGPSSKE